MNRKPLSYRIPKTGTPFGPEVKSRSAVYDVATECAKQGIEAYKNGISVEACPYPSGSINERAWVEAWEILREKTERIGPMVI